MILIMMVMMMVITMMILIILNAQLLNKIKSNETKYT